MTDRITGMKYPEFGKQLLARPLRDILVDIVYDWAIAHGIPYNDETASFLKGEVSLVLAGFPAMRT